MVSKVKEFQACNQHASIVVINEAELNADFKKARLFFKQLYLKKTNNLSTFLNQV